MLYVTNNHGCRGVILGYFTFTFLTLFLKLEASTFCPDLCKCVEFGNGRPDKIVSHVRCRGIIEDLDKLTLPKNTMFLHASNVSLQFIPSYYFMDRGLVGIIELDLSNNQLTHIYSDIFVGLNDLKALNLSYNKIVYFDSHSLIYNDFLTHLVLKGTYLPVADSSLVISRSLELLDISDCGIGMLPNLALSEIPYLKILNVSLNPLRGIDPHVFDNLQWLKKLDITRTNIRCDRKLAALSEWGKISAVAITGYPCLNSHSLDGHSYRNFRRLTTISDNGPEWPTPVPRSEEEMEGLMETAESKEVDLESEDSVEDDSGITDDTFHESSASADSGVTGSPEEEMTADPQDSTLPDFLQIHWTIWLACAGGFGLGVALTIGLGFSVYMCCKQPADPNELISAGEDFQLVPQPVNHSPVIRDQPPSYSSLFASRYHKVLPTAPVHSNRRY